MRMALDPRLAWERIHIERMPVLGMETRYPVQGRRTETL